MHKISPELRSCIDSCIKCYEVCLNTSMSHCLESGGKHVEPEHFKLMTACAEICRSAAALMLIGTEHHRRLCKVCAEICDDCAKSCESVGDMNECVQTCRACAESCRKMAA